jgi:hypothetical protein
VPFWSFAGEGVAGKGFAGGVEGASVPEPTF